jgi:biopolymer transport protein ExbD
MGRKLFLLVCIVFGSCANNETPINALETNAAQYLSKRGSFSKRTSVFDKKREYSEEEIIWKRKYEIFQIFVDENNQILVGEELIKLENLKSTGKAFYHDYWEVLDSPYADEAMISLRGSRKVNYQFYLSVYSELRQIYTELWEEEAQRTYNTSFRRLKMKDKKGIRKKIPLTLSESEPAEF